MIVIEADDRKAAELAMIENLQREDLNPMEEAAGFQSLIETYHMTQEEAARQVGKSRSAVTNSLRLLSLTPAVRQLVEEGKLSAGHARALLPLSPALQENAANAVVAGRAVRPADGGTGQKAVSGKETGKRTGPPACGLRRRSPEGSDLPAWPGRTNCERPEKRPY